jgi:hypothetical protein
MFSLRRLNASLTECRFDGYQERCAVLVIYGHRGSCTSRFMFWMAIVAGILFISCWEDNTLPALGGQEVGPEDDMRMSSNFADHFPLLV